jgi:hypothetical protein
VSINFECGLPLLYREKDKQRTNESIRFLKSFEESEHFGRHIQNHIIGNEIHR